MDLLPSPDASHLVEAVPGGASGNARRWTLRDDNCQHYHGCVPSRESPVTIRLSWRSDRSSPVHLIGSYRLHLSALLASGYVREEPVGGSGDEIRIRFCRRGRYFYLQVRNGDPALVVGAVPEQVPIPGFIRTSE